MNRKEFLLSCGSGLCACAAIGLVDPTSAMGNENKPPEDWRFQFIKKRYSKLLEIMLERLDEKTVTEILEQLGRSCASEDPLVKKHKGDIEGYIREFKKQSKEPVTLTYDPEKKLITIAGPETSDCACPLVDCRNTPKIVCNCSAGYNAYIFETLLGKKVRPECVESVVRGGKRCAFNMHVEDQPA